MLNRNIGCIEILENLSVPNTIKPLNRNIGCIEMIVPVLAY